MVLKKIEITGFKSFAGKSVVDFNTSDKNTEITAVVGPNGSGKSNVADAIRWALGEQSYKLLRSKKSEDVVFQGSEKKQKGSFAEVNLILDNTKKKLKIDYTEVTISRRLYRSGENEYRINGSKVRLMDVQDLLARCGFGQATYTVIGQGMVDQMLFYGAKERKVLFDEAAGVKQYELKREQSLRKLEGTDQNLLRVKDILSELSPRLKTLKRQVEKAEEKKVLEKELNEVLSKYYSYKWNKYEGKIAEKKKGKDEIEKEKSAVEKELNEINVKLESDEDYSYKALSVLRADLRKISEERDEVKEKYIVLSGNIRVEEQKESLDDAKRFVTEISQKEENILAIENKIKEKEKEIQDKKKELSNLMKDMSDVQNKLIAAQSGLKETEGGDENLLKLKKEYQDLSKKQADLLSILEKSRSLADIKKAREKALEISKSIDGFWQKVKSLNKKDVQSGVFARIEKISQLKEEKLGSISEIKVKIGSIEAEISALKEQKSHYIAEIERLKKAIEGVGTSKETDENIKKMREELEVLEKELKERESNIESINRGIRKEEDEEKGREKEIYELRTKNRDKQRLVDEYNYSLRDIEVEMARIETRKEDLKEEIVRDLSMDEVLKTKAESMEQEKTEDKIRTLRTKISNIGGIDEESEEEYKEIGKRHAYLEEQLTDLNKAKEDLKKIIRELDEKIKVQFDEAFAKIAREFKKYFTVLFDGGNASLTLNKVREESNFASDEASLDKDEGLGIEITASPPGKKVKSLNALSGGERTLASLALLFAILSVNPSPFCVLDEVDAALDETNTKRFIKILEELSRSTQFIVITHNRDTMRAADILYGVTMNAEHVSKLLSLKLKEAEAVAGS